MVCLFWWIGGVLNKKKQKERKARKSAKLFVVLGRKWKLEVPFFFWIL